MSPITQTQTTPQQATPNAETPTLNESGKDSPPIESKDTIASKQLAATTGETQGLTAEGKALMQALQEIDKESEIGKNSSSEEKTEDTSERSFSMKKALTAAATIGGILLAVA